MNRNEIWQAVELELRKNKKEHPSYPDHVVAQSAMVSKASGLLTIAAIDFKYHFKLDDEYIRELEKELLFKEGVRVAVQAIRFLENLK